MKTCPKCNNVNRDEAKFCTSCGENLGTQPLDTNVTNTIQDYSAGSSSNGIPYNQPAAASPVPGASQPSGSSPAKKSKGLLYIIAGIAAIAVIFLLVRLFSNADPVSKLLKGYSKLAKMKEITTITTVDINYEGDDEVGELLNDMDFKIITAADMENLLAQITLEMLYDKKSVARVAAGVTNEDFYIELKDLYKNLVYQEMEEVVPDYQDYINDFKLIKKAFDDVQFKFDNKKYIKIIRNTLGDDIKSSGNKVILTMNQETMTELLENLLEEAEEDEKLMESVRKYGISLIKRILKDEKKFKVIEVDELEELLEILEDEDEFEEYYTNAISQFISGLGYGLDNAIDFDLDIDEYMEDLEITFIFGASGAIKSVEFSISDDDEFEVFISTEIKSGTDLAKINKKNAIALEEIMNDSDELEAAVEEITENLIKTIKKNKKLAEKIEDLSGESVEDYIEYMMYNIFSFAAW